MNGKKNLSNIYIVARSELTLAVIPGNKQFAHCQQSKIRGDKIFHHPSQVTPSTDYIHHLWHGYVQTYVTYNDNESNAWPTKVTQRNTWVGPYAK